MKNWMLLEGVKFAGIVGLWVIAAPEFGLKWLLFLLSIVVVASASYRQGRHDALDKPNFTKA